MSKDGPIYRLNKIKKIKDFSKYKVDFIGKESPLD